MTIILYRDNVPVVDLTDSSHAAAVAHWQYVPKPVLAAGDGRLSYRQPKTAKLNNTTLRKRST